MPLSYVTAEGTNVANQLVSYSAIDLFTDIPHKDQLVVSLEDQTLDLTDDYTIDTVNKQVTILEASIGTIKIERSTEIEDRLVTFTNTSILTQQDMNKNTDQLLFLAQELNDKINSVTLTAVGSIPDGSIGSEKLNQVSGQEAVVTDAIRNDAVQTAKIADGAVTTVKIANDAVDNDKMSAGAPTWTTGGNVDVLNNLDVAGNLVVDLTTTTNNLIVNNNIEVVGQVNNDLTIGDDLSVLGNMSFNSGYGSSAPAYGCRAWANFTVSTPETTTNPFGGTATVSRTSGSTTAVVTTTNDHGLRVGHKIYAASGVQPAAYVITDVPTTKTFEFTTVATTVLSGAAITFNWRTITASANVHSVSELATDRFGINLNTTMPDANYAVIANSVHTAESAVSVDANTATSIMTWAPSVTSYALNGVASVNSIHTAVFR